MKEAPHSSIVRANEVRDILMKELPEVPTSTHGGVAFSVAHDFDKFPQRGQGR